MGEEKMSFFDLNQCSTSATDCGFGSRGSASQNEYFHWTAPEKHCGGVAKCGSVCHKTINCTIVDKEKRDGKTVYKYYCRKCKTYNEGSAEDCK